MKHWREHHLAGSLITIFAAVCWGFSGTCGEFMFKTHGVSSEWLTITRMLVAGFLLLLIARIQGHGARIFAIWKSSDWPRLVLFATAGLLFCQYTYLKTISYTNSGTATFLQDIAPALVLAYICVTTRRLPNLVELISALAVIFGVFILATHGAIHNLVISRQGLSWGIIAALAYAAYMLIPENLLTRWGASIITGWGLLIGGITALVIFHPIHESITWDFAMLFGLFGLIIIGTAMSYSLYLFGVYSIGPLKASMLACIEPISAALFSHFWLGTPFYSMDVLGFIFILSATLMLIANPKRLIKRR